MKTVRIPGHDAGVTKKEHSDDAVLHPFHQNKLKHIASYYSILGTGLLWELCFFPLWDCFLDLLSCPFPLLFAAFWSWKLQHFGVRTSHFPRYLQHFGARTVHAICTYSFRVGLGLVSLGVGVGLVFGLVEFFRVDFRYSFGLV